jgi:hypothetical protein
MPLTDISPFYRVGTATFAATTAVTGQGTAWLSNAAPGDIIYNRLGQAAEIASVNSDTSITLAVAFGGAVQTAQAYSIYRVPDATRLENFSQRLLNLLLGGNLTSFGNLDGVGGGKVPVFTGAGALATRTFAELLGSLGAPEADDVVLKAANGADFADKRATLDTLMRQGTNIASAATLNLAAATGHFLDVTGTVATTAITLSDGSWRLVRAAAAWPITTSANLVLNNGATPTYTCAAGDMILFVADGAVIRGVIFPVNGQPVERVVNARLAQMATARVKGRVTAGTGDAEDLTQAQVRTFLGMSSFFTSLLDDVTGAAVWDTLGAAQSLARPGWCKLPNGLIVQWSLSSGTNPVTVTFPTAFPTACWSVVGNVQSGNNGQLGSLVLYDMTLTQFKAIKKATNGSQVYDMAEGFSWLAIGM